MGQCCMRNCYGTDMADLKFNLKLRLPFWLTKLLMEIGKCANSQTQRNGLANFNALTLYTAKQVYDKLDDLDRSGGYYDISSPENIFKDDLSRILSDFDYLLCNGGSKDIDDLLKKYGFKENGDPISKFPAGLSESDKDKIRELFNKNNNFNDNIANKNDKMNYITIPGTGNSEDNDDDIFGNSNDSDRDKNFLIKIPDDEISGINTERKIYKCFEPKFKIENYIIGGSKNLYLTNSRIANIKRVHDEILIPLFRYYYGENAPATCQMTISFGLGSLKTVREYAGGGSFSRHLHGEAVDFLMSGVDPQQVLKDIREKKVNIDFGVICLINGLHITLPYMFEGYSVNRLLLSSPKNSKSSLSIDFI